MLVKDWINLLKDKLIPLYGKNEADAIIRLIFHHVKGWSLTDILINQEKELSSFISKEMEDILQRLLQHEPIQYIIEEGRFHGHDLYIKPGVLIPRHETEELTDIIIERNKGRSDLKILDICTGSACIALALARALPFSEVSAIDYSDTAIEVAQENAKRLKIKLNLVKNDIFVWNPDGKFDIIVSNPPYVMDKEAVGMDRNVLDYEPHEAIFVRDDRPLVFYERIIEISRNHIEREGQLYLEINPLLCVELQTLLALEGFKEIETIKDFYGKNRFICCKFE